APFAECADQADERPRLRQGLQVRPQRSRRDCRHVVSAERARRTEVLRAYRPRLRERDQDAAGRLGSDQAKATRDVISRASGLTRWAHRWLTEAAMARVQGRATRG